MSQHAISRAVAAPAEQRVTQSTLRAGDRRRVSAWQRRAIPVHWSFLLGAISLSCFTVLVVTGVFLMAFYDPSSDTVRYDGSYPLLQGVPVSKAYASTLHISFEVPGGLLARQAHHWAALLLPASLMLQLLTTFFTGGFRRPRHWSWVLLALTFVLALAGGWSGYGLPDDMLSGTGLRIVEGILIGLPLIGTRATFIVFGGEYPGSVIEHMYWLHVAVVPVLLVLVLALRLRLAVRRRPAQFRSRGRTEDNVVGLPLPAVAVRAFGLFLITAGVVDAPGRLRRDQSGLALRAVVRGPRLGRKPARLVHELPRRRAASGPFWMGRRGARRQPAPGGARPAARRRSLPGARGAVALPREQRDR